MSRLSLVLPLSPALLLPLQAQEEDKGIAAHFDKRWREDGEPRTPLDDLPTVHLSIVYCPHYSGYRQFQIEIVNSTKEDLRFSGYGKWPRAFVEMGRQGRWEYDEERNMICGVGLGSHTFEAGESLVDRYDMDNFRRGPDRRLLAAFSSKDSKKASFLPLVELPLSDEFVIRWSREIARLPDDPEKYALWEKHMLAAVDFHGKRKPEDAIPMLAWWVARLGQPDMEKGERPVFCAARNALLAIPGHAAWIGKEIGRISDGCTAGEGDFGRGDRHRYFEALEQLPAPETVKALGELFMDGEKPRQGYYWDGTRDHAVETLEKLGIVNPLVREDPPPPPPSRNAGEKPRVITWEEARQLQEEQARREEEAWQRRLEAWRLWCRQVRAGARTFSFEGDDTIYSLSGPVGQALDPGGDGPAHPEPPENEIPPAEHPGGR